MPDSWGVAAGGKPSTEPAEILNGGGLLPLGGSEIAGKRTTSDLHETVPSKL